MTSEERNDPSAAERARASLRQRRSRDDDTGDVDRRLFYAHFGS
jgi:hypothetical protein